MADAESNAAPNTASGRGELSGSKTGGGWGTSFLLLLVIVSCLTVSAITWARRDQGQLKIAPEALFSATHGNLFLTVSEEGKLESANNAEIKCKVRGDNTVTFVVDSGTKVNKGDVLIRLDTLQIEEEINGRTKDAYLSQSKAERALADVKAAEIALTAYREGTFIASLMEKEKELAIAESDLLTAKNVFDHVKMLVENEYSSELSYEESEFAVTSSGLNRDAIVTELGVLEKFDKNMQLKTLEGDLNAAKATYQAEREQAEADAMRRDRALEELEFCVIRAERGGMVIHPNAAAWRAGPEIEEGATVNKDQVLLLMPDLEKMQIELGIHESLIERVHIGQEARVDLADRTIPGKVLSVSDTANPAGWWTGVAVKYKTVIELPPLPDLKPGMTADVDIVLARYQDELLIPVNAVVETQTERLCWVATETGVERRVLKLGETNDLFVIVEEGVHEGEQVVMAPLTHVPTAQAEASLAFSGAAKASPGERQGDSE